MKDKNGVRIKHRDIIRINAEWFSKNLKIIMAVWGKGNKLNVYNPNCCIYCRNERGCICELDCFQPEQVEVIGNLDTTPELLPFRELTESEG